MFLEIEGMYEKNSLFIIASPSPLFRRAGCDTVTLPLPVRRPAGTRISYISHTNQEITEKKEKKCQWKFGQIYDARFPPKSHISCD